MKKETIIIDAKGRPLGKLAVEVVRILSGKHKPTYVPYEDRGDFVTIKNIKEVELSGKKKEQKIYYSHSGFLGGLKEMPFKKLFERDPREVLKRAVYGMLPSNKLRDQMIKKLKFE